MEVSYETLDRDEITPVSPEDFIRGLVDIWGELSAVTVIGQGAFTGLIAILRGQSGPSKLCIDGREYHRRQRRRTKSKQRR